MKKVLLMPFAIMLAVALFADYLLDIVVYGKEKADRRTDDLLNAIEKYKL